MDIYSFENDIGDYIEMSTRFTFCITGISDVKAPRFDPEFNLFEIQIIKRSCGKIMSKFVFKYSAREEEISARIKLLYSRSFDKLVEVKFSLCRVDMEVGEDVSKLDSPSVYRCLSP